MKVALVHRMVCHYQREYLTMFYNELAGKGTELKIFCGIVEDTVHPYPRVMVEKIKHWKFNVNVGGLDEKLVVLPPLFGALKKYRPDIIVTEDISAMPNCLAVLAYSRICGIPYLIWGLGIIPKKKSSTIRFLLEPFISLFRNGATAFLCYSSHARNYYFEKYKKPCYLMHNSTTLPHTKAELDEITKSVHRKYANPGETKIAFIGRLLPQKRVDLLLQTAAVVNRILPVSVDVIGDGLIKNKLVALCDELGILGRVYFHGQITDKEAKKRLFLNAHLGVLPGLGGLAIQEMMWYGLPVITSHADGTERDLVKDRETGFFVDEMNEATLTSAIIQFIGLSGKDKIKMAINGLQIINRRYNVESMVSTFIQAVNETACGKKV